MKKIALGFFFICCGFLVFFKLVSPFSLQEKEQFLSQQVYSDDAVLLRHVPSAKNTYSQWEVEYSKYLLLATITAEDKRFYYHLGIDPIALARSLYQNLTEGRLVSGASTLAQQTMRRIKHHPRSFGGKLKTMFDGVWLSVWASKEKQLELYLNLVPYSNQIVGVNQASYDYFRTSAKDLSLAQAAFLAVIPQSPTILNPYKNFDLIEKKQKLLLKRMLAQKQISNQEYQRAIAEKLNLFSLERPFLAPHFTEFVLSQKPKQKKVVTTLDWGLQKKLLLLQKEHLAKVQKYHITQAAFLVLDNQTRSVLAWSGSVDFLNKENQGQVDGVLAYRQPGSALKPFTYALALQNGFTAASILPDIRTHYYLNENERYIPRNYSHTYHGPVTLRQALAGSLNIPAVFIAKKIGPAKIYELLDRMQFYLPEKPWHYGLGITLGNAEVRLLDLTNAYATLAKEGVWQEVSFLKKDRIKTPRKPVQVLEPASCALIGDILADQKSRNRFFGIQHPFHFSYPVAVKTGTSSNWRDNWAMGYTQAVSLGVWVGNFDGLPMLGTSGATGSGPLFRTIMDEVNQQYPSEKPLASKSYFIGQTVCPLSGKRRNQYCPDGHEELFLPGLEPKELCDYHQKIKFDSRNGLLAGPRCLERWVDQKVSVRYPAEYQDWAIRHGRGVHRYSPLCPYFEVPQEIEILFPKNRARFRLNPNHHPDFQTIPLKVKLNSQPKTVEWFVDGDSLGKVSFPYTLRYPLVRGDHQVWVKVENKKSETILFSVD